MEPLPRRFFGIYSTDTIDYTSCSYPHSLVSFSMLLHISMVPGILCKLVTHLHPVRKENGPSDWDSLSGMGHILFRLRGQGYPVHRYLLPGNVPYISCSTDTLSIAHEGTLKLYSSWHYLVVVSSCSLVVSSPLLSSHLLFSQTHLAFPDLEAARPL